jgi:hypothetical protein
MLGFFLFLATCTAIVGERTIMYAVNDRAGMADRLVVLNYMLKMSLLLNANLSFPRPCASLAPEHTSTLPDCSVGWDKYIQVSPVFYGYNDKIVQPKCNSRVFFVVTLDYNNVLIWSLRRKIFFFF